MIRVTLICPEPWLADARQLLMALGSGPDDANALQLSGWRNQHTGVNMAVASTEMHEDWLAKLSAPILRPAWDLGGSVDISAANRAQMIVHLWQNESDLSMSNHEAIHVAYGIDPLGALKLANIKQVSEGF